MVDIVILAVMGISLVFGLFRGLLRELLSLVSWVFAFWIAYRYSANVAEIIDRALQNPTLSQAVSAVLVFVIVLVALMVLTSLIAKVFKATGLAGIDRILGGLFGLGRGVVILL
ncbi:MAG TPA: colicin V production CvpA, partial [Gammaproteobacteria bacterium]|nr:colicin V production CvpA [Gammaproteobacteria bacterium]